MNCPNVKECACPKESCQNHKRCCACVVQHRGLGNLPFCLREDRIMENLYQKLREQFEGR